MTPEVLYFRNEFAHVRLTLQEGRCGARLEVCDLKTGVSTHLDPLELASLCEWPDEARVELVTKPAMYRGATA